MNKFLYRSNRFLKQNASTILTCIGGVGVIATAVTAVRATPKALQQLELAEQLKGEDLTVSEKVQIAGPAYIPSILIGATTIACIFGANALNKHQQASLMSAYALLDRSFKDYKEKVDELYGEEAGAEVRASIAKDKYEDEEISIKDIEKRLFYDDFSGRYFESTMEDVIKAEYALNRQLSLHSGAYLNEWYELLDIPAVDYGDYLGWSQAILMDMSWISWLEFHHEKVILDDDFECYIIRFGHDPMADFEYY
jgi:hypothetical protein